MPDIAELGRKVKAKYPGQYDDLDDGEVGRRVRVKYPGAYDDFTDTPPATVLPQDRQTFGRRPATLDESLTQSARANRGRPQPSKVDMDTMTINPEGVRRAKQEAFEKKPFTEQWTQRLEDAVERGGRQAGGMVLKAAGAGLGVAGMLQGRPFEVVDVKPDRFETPDAVAEERLASRRQLYRPSFAGDVVEGIAEGAPQAAGALILGGLTGGGLPAAMAIGGGMGAAGADWNDPRRAAAQTAISAVAPVVGGKVGQGIGGAIASRVARPVAQGAARAGGEVVGGAAGNVIGSGAEQLAFDGRLNPRELARQGIIGGALNVPGAVSAGRRRGAITEPLPETEQIPAAQPVVALQQPEALPTVTPPRVRSPRQTVEIPRVPTAPTQRIPTAPKPVYPDALETQEMPEIRARIAAENATTRELPQQAIMQEPTGSRDPLFDQAKQTLAEFGKDSPVILQRRLKIGYNRAANLMEQIRAERAPVQEPTNRIMSGEGAELPRRVSPPREGQPVEIPTRPQTAEFPEVSTPGRRVSQEFQVPGGLKKAESFISREDARQGHFEQFDDAELVQEIRRMEDVQNQATRGRSKLSREELEANRFDLKTAVGMQKERRRLQQQIGVEAGERIPVRAPARGRKIQHSQFGAVSEAADQSGVGKGRLRVVDETGELHVIKNPRTKGGGNREAAFVRSIPDEAMPELQMPNAPKAPQAGRERPVSPIDYTIPAEAMPELRGKAQPPNIVQKMASLGRTPSSPVEIAKLRAEFPGMSKADFDGAMAKLNEEGRIALQRHDHPASLKEADRANMVQIGKDYFTAATFRERPGQVMGMGLGALQPLMTKQNLKRAGAEAVDLINLPRALMASADLSAPLRQGAILTLPPTQWGRASKAGLRMFQALSTKHFEKISEQINTHPDAETGRKAKLYISTDKTEGLRKSEEDFLSRWADKIPIVKQSQQAYQTYLDSLRMDTFAKYKRVIDKTKGLSPEQRDSAYKAAAEWINTATGRGTLGKTFESGMPLLSKVAFAPRYTASRVQILNPVTYAKNASTPAGRAVLKQQMTDVVQFAGVVSATLAIAKAAGAEVGTDPEDSDFLKIKVGNVRYDTLAGLQQVMRLFYRTGKDVGMAAVGKKSEQGEGAIEVAGRFARSKLAPVPSFFVDALSRKDFIGRDFEVGRGVKERMIPLMWKDFYDAYQREGIGAAAKLTPGVFGLGVQDFAKKPGVLTQKNEAYTGELKRLGVKPAESARRLKGEPEDLFKGRTGKIESWRDQYGAQLIQHPMYQRLSDEQKKAAIESLHQRISQQANEKRPNLSAFRPAAIARGVREGERSRRRTDRDKIYVAPR